jgi:Cu(I)/Ag(I) efflux system protein CusF
MKRMITAVLVALAAGFSAHAQDSSLAEGEVRRVDREAKKITIRHGPLANLDMGPMTMVFQVKEPAMLESVKPGDKVRFRVEKVGGALTVMKIEPLVQ